MTSPVPRHLTTEIEHRRVPAEFRSHRVDLKVDSTGHARVPGSGAHRARYAPGLATELLRLAATDSIGDPMAGCGTLAHETGAPAALNDIDPAMRRFLTPLEARGCTATFVPAHRIEWHREACIFSPPYYPKADRKKPCAHNDAARGPVVGFRDSYECEHPDLIGNPGGVNAIATYRKQMRAVYRHLGSVCGKMIVVTKNWTRLGVEMRLDLDTILMCQDEGWSIQQRHGWIPPASLWSRFNSKRGGGVRAEDILVFVRGRGAAL